MSPGQLIIDYARLARARDPLSSVEAAKRHVESGRFVCHRDFVFELVKRRPGATARELEQFGRSVTIIGYEKVELDYHEIMRRLNDLADRTPWRGDKTCPIYRGPERQCKISGRKVLTWHLKR